MALFTHSKPVRIFLYRFNASIRFLARQYSIQIRAIMLDPALARTIGSPRVKHNRCAPFTTAEAAISKVNGSDDTPVARQVDLATRSILVKTVSDIRRKSSAVSESHDHVIYLDRGSPDDNPQFPEASFPPTDLDPVMVRPEIGLALAQKLPTTITAAVITATRRHARR
jgi:hypothetical protein